MHVHTIPIMASPKTDTGGHQKQDYRLEWPYRMLLACSLQLKRSNFCEELTTP